jgi:toxin ParE1/3/4
MIVEMTATAMADVESIGDHIARRHPDHARGFLRDINRSCMELAEMPADWPVVPRYRLHAIHRRAQGRYLIFYRAGPDRITVLHVLNGAMEVDAILLPEG